MSFRRITLVNKSGRSKVIRLNKEGNPWSLVKKIKYEKVEKIQYMNENGKIIHIVKEPKEVRNVCNHFHLINNIAIWVGDRVELEALHFTSTVPKLKVNEVEDEEGEEEAETDIFDIDQFKELPETLMTTSKKGTQYMSKIKKYIIPKKKVNIK